MDQMRERRRIAGPIDAYDEQPKQEFVKCVVVGDGAVGKTRLICSYVYNQPSIALSRLNQGAHHPSVFAIDQYMVDSGIRERANVVIDGVPVCLRLWDTFGDHEKNRRFAYQDAHVVLLCFSIGMRSSLKNINAVWYPEIRKYCPRAPIILVGTQQDRRHTDPVVLRQLSKVTHLKCMLGLDHNFEDIVLPETGRQTGREIGSVCYLEASVITKYGVDEVFENVLRAALISKGRNRAIFSSHLRRIKKPQLQVPYLPPPNDPGTVYVPPSQLKKELLSDAKHSASYANVTWLVEGEMISCQAAILLASDTAFADALTHPHILTATRSKTEQIILCRPNGRAPNYMLQDGSVNGRAGMLPRGVSSVDTYGSDDSDPVKILMKLENVSAAAAKVIAKFLTTGLLKKEELNEDVAAAASHLQCTPLLDRRSSSSGHVTDSINLFPDRDADLFFSRRMKQVLSYALYYDVVFQLENGSLRAHKWVLVSQCDVMAAMFRDQNFKESIKSQVDFQSVNCESFSVALEYLYTGNITDVEDQFGTLELANYLGLPRLVAVVEQHVIKQIKGDGDSPETLAKVIDLYLAAELHNAPQLASFCLHFLSINYNSLYKQCSLDLKHLHSEALSYIEKHRWPPVWYLKEQDYYARKNLELQKEHEKKRNRRKRRCRCF